MVSVLGISIVHWEVALGVREHFDGVACLLRGGGFDDDPLRTMQVPSMWMCSLGYSARRALVLSSHDAALGMCSAGILKVCDMPVVSTNDHVT